jgi:Fe2+ transport system protein B
MADVADAKNINIDRTKLSQELQVPVVRTVARKDEGTSELLDAIIGTVKF